MEQHSLFDHYEQSPLTQLPNEDSTIDKINGLNYIENYINVKLVKQKWLDD